MSETPYILGFIFPTFTSGKVTLQTGIDQADVVQKLLQVITEFLPRTNIMVQSVFVTGDIAFSGATMFQERLGREPQVK